MHIVITPIGFVKRYGRGQPNGLAFSCHERAAQDHVQKGLLQRVKVLYVDKGTSVAYLQITPYQAHTIWALQAAGVQLWGERYGATSDELPAMDRLDASQITLDRLTMTMTDTLKLYSPNGVGGGIPGSGGALSGESVTTPGQQLQPNTASSQP
jgi:hypothetical protein